MGTSLDFERNHLKNPIMRDLPLYNYLAIQPECHIDKKRLSSSLSHLPHQHATAIQVLILHHRMLNGGHESIPYDGQLLMQDNGVIYRDMDEFPSKLLNILHHYIEMAS
jgi:hypothetical protein